MRRTYTYDGDGRRVLRDTATETVAHVGPHYELRFDKQPMPEDLDDDCRVTVIDIIQVAAQWGQTGGPEDLDDSGTVDVEDIQQVAGEWRETCHVLADITKYYTLGGQRIAMRKAGTLYCLFTDHPDSTSVAYGTTNGQHKRSATTRGAGCAAGMYPPTAVSPASAAMLQLSCTIARRATTTMQQEAKDDAWSYIQ